MATMKVMSGYSYKKLGPGEIRLMTLLPGDDPDLLSFSIWHTSIKHARQLPASEATSMMRQVQNSLPAGWTVKETLSGRKLFMRMGYSGTPITWTHPDPAAQPDGWQDNTVKPVTCPEPSYEALSYVWGAPSDIEPANVIELGSSPAKPFIRSSIGASLAIALRHLRYTDRSRTLWVDAICINQNDVLERNLQVKRMGEIYSSAARVLVWLGAQADGSEYALRTLDYFSQQVEYTTDESIGDAPMAKEPRWWDAEYALPYDQAIWDSLVSLFRRPWFSRVWVLQEALLAHEGTVICGAEQIPWYSLRKAMVVLAEKLGLPAALFALLGSYRMGLLNRGMWSLPRLLLWGTFRQCTDPRDKVYGILSLLSTRMASAIVVDYALPVEHVYMHTLMSHVEMTGRLHLLRHCHLEDRAPNSPSWVPNFAVTKQSFFGFRKGHNRQPSGHTATDAFCKQPGVLEASGLLCATVNAVQDLPRGDLETAFAAAQSFSAAQMLADSYVAGGSMLTALSEVITKGRLCDRYPNIQPFPKRADISQGLAAVLNGAAKMEDTFSYFKEEFRLENSFLCSTKEGYLGISEARPLKDDCVCVLLGCDYPILLRPTGSGEYLVVGQIFVHGLMDGESLLGSLPPDWEIRMLPGGDGREVTCFFNATDSALTRQDPRLPEMPPEWNRLKRDRVQDDPFFHQDYQNRDSGEIINFDPRVGVAALTSRGEPASAADMIDQAQEKLRERLAQQFEKAERVCAGHGDIVRFSWG
ncbi:uncharacterized protein AB675_11923 [Cyphellophora attinorum]|uniref:Heterokaryon incompatibility domain-containing protein n=1 Tax=Cyphellophora attinorum TaxID=1664694 RepID=A0A0N1NX78_9EURO|nr:uncharacterized protein AB675_11923 [Phialophora attinorum]KPI34983.1 hypothetical protein AB675_11923 [Phialophora attinorum]